MMMMMMMDSLLIGFEIVGEFTRFYQLASIDIYLQR